jgi:hypothetical protein
MRGRALAAERKRFLLPLEGEGPRPATSRANLETDHAEHEEQRNCEERSETAQAVRETDIVAGPTVAMALERTRVLTTKLKSLRSVQRVKQ